MRHVIVGGSIAGLSAAETLRAADAEAQITLVSEEGHRPYCRPLISYWLAGEISESLFDLPSKALGSLDFLARTRATGIDPARKTLSLQGGGSLAYDRLLLATGAGSRKLGLPGEEAANVFDFRTLDDAQALDGAVGNGARRAVVLGGGLVGVQAAKALAARGLEVLLCIASPYPLSQTVDPEAGRLAAGALAEEGIEVRTGHVPEAVVCEGGTATAVRFREPAGRVEPCDLIVRGKGVAPRTELLSGLGVDCRGGIPVDPQLRTPLPDVWAAGDCVSCFDPVWGVPRQNAIWPVAVEQGLVAGANMAGGAGVYEGSVARNSVSIGGLHFVSAGITNPPNGSFSTLQGRPSGEVLYRKAVLRSGTLVGFVSVETEQVGRSASGIFVAAVQARAPLADIPFDPLSPVLHWRSDDLKFSR